jgi:uncharacterized membrane protein YGL010W
VKRRAVCLLLPRMFTYKLCFARDLMVHGAVAPSGQANAGLAQWINFEAIQLLTHHASAIIVAVVLFGLVGWLIRRLMHDSLMKRVVLVIDELVLVCIFAYFAYELIFFLYLRTRSFG